MNVHDIYPSNWLKARDLAGREFTLTVRAVTMEEVQPQPGQREQVAVVWFEKAQKGLILNKTMALVIAEAFGAETDGWPGQRVTLYPERVRAFGKEREVVRVRAAA